MANLANPNAVRKYAGLNPDDVPDNELDFYIDEADRIVFGDTAIQVTGETLCGKVNGENSIFTTAYRYIADTDFDCAITSSDVTVYAWGTAGDLDTKEEWNIDSVDGNEGKIYISSSSIPSSTYDCMTIDYYYYKHKPNWNMLRRAANFWAAYDYIFAEYLLIPTSLRRGALSWRHVKPYKDLLNRYYEAINFFNKRIYSKKFYKDIVMSEKYLEEY